MTTIRAAVGLLLTIAIPWSPLLAAEPGPAEDISLADFTVMALAPLEEQAILRWPDGSLKLVRVGDAIPRALAVVREVLDDRLIFEQRMSEASRTVWLYRAEAGRSRVRILETRTETPWRALKPPGRPEAEGGGDAGVRKLIRPDGSVVPGDEAEQHEDEEPRAETSSTRDVGKESEG